MEKQKIPIGVKIISILYYISTILVFLLIIELAIVSPFEPTFVGLFGIAAIAFHLLIGIGLWKGQNWSRIVSITFSMSFAILLFLMVFLHLTFTLINLPEISNNIYLFIIIFTLSIGTILPLISPSIIGIFIGVINLGVASYLLFNKNVKSAFSALY